MVDGYGLKMTPQRRAIIEFLQSSVDHPTAEDIMNAVNERFPMTSRPTVYNTLNWLKGSGLINEVFEGERSATIQTPRRTTISYAAVAGLCRTLSRR